MASKKHFFVLTFLTLYYLTQNVYAQDSTAPANGGDNDKQSPSYRDWLYKTNGSKGSENSDGTSDPNKSSTDAGVQSDPNAGGNQQSESGGIGSENGNGSSSDPESSNDPSSSGAGSTSEGTSGSGNDQSGSTPENGNGQGSSSDPESSNDPSSGGTGSTSEGTSGSGNDQSGSGSMGSENGNVQTGPSSPVSSNEPSENEKEQNPEPSDPAAQEATEKQKSGSETGETKISENKDQTKSSNTGSNEGGQKKKTEFEKEPLVYKMIDFILNPVEGVTRIFLHALRRSGAATVESVAQMGSDILELTNEVGGVLIDPSQMGNLTKNIARESVGLPGNIVSRFTTVAADVANETRLGLGESLVEGRVLAGTLGQTGINATKSGIKGTTKGVTTGAVKAVNATKNTIVKDCVWYKVGVANNCVPFRLWKLTEFPFKFSIKTAILPVKLAINSALLPITLPINSALLPIKLAFGSLKVGGSLAKDSVKGGEVGLKGAKAAAPTVLAGTKAGVGFTGQVGGRLLYHTGRFLGLFIP